VKLNFWALVINKSWVCHCRGVLSPKSCTLICIQVEGIFNLLPSYGGEWQQICHPWERSECERD
jgi:hypothetical protein